MGKTITGTHTLGVTLAVNPTLIKGTITTTATPAIYGSAAKTWTITNKGEVASTGIGINLAGGAKITNIAHATILGGSEAIFARKAATISNAGTIAISSSYGTAIVLNGGAITNSASGLISGGLAIVSAGTAALHILNQGIITGTGAFGDAIEAPGTITNAATGTIIGHTGIRLSAGTIINAGLIEGTGTAGYAVILSGTSNTEIIEQKTGTIIGDIHGFLSGDTIDEAGLTITSERFSNNTLTLLNGTATIATLNIDGFLNTGAFTLASDGHGGTDILLGSATFAGTYTGNTYLATQNTTIAATARLISNAGSGLEGNTYRNWNLVNHGTIIAAVFGAGVDFFGGGTITNTGLIQGAYGIYLTGGTITNAGTITGTRAAINLAATTATAEIILKSGGVLNGAIAGFETGDTIDLAAITATGETFSNGILTLTNAGKVVDTIAIAGLFNSAAFKLGAAPGGGTDITIAPAETFSGHYSVALTLSSLFTSITNTGSISSASDGVFARGGRNWTLANSGTLAGNFYGVFINNAALTNTAHGLIEGRTGVFGDVLNIDNAGTILGLATTNYGGYGISQIGAAVSVNRATGTIAGAKHGANVFGGTLTNAGSIIGQIGAYIIGGTLTNTGTIIGTGGSSYSTYRDAGPQIRSGFASNAATGIIAGPNGVLLLGGSVTNAGLIEGLPGGQSRNIYGQVVSIASTGVTLNAGILTNLATGIISGATGIAFNGGTLIDAGTIATTLARGNAISFGQGYSTLILDPGNVIKGAIAGFAGADTIDFTNQTFSSESLAAGTLTLFNNGISLTSLAFNGGQNASEFTLTSDGAGGTKLLLGPERLTGTYQYGITLSAVRTSIASTALVEVLAGHAGPGNPSGYALVDDTGTGHTIINSGRVIDTYDGKSGAFLGAETFINNAGATLSGAAGIKIAGRRGGPAASLSNAGTIIGIRPGGYGLNETYGVFSNDKTGTITGATGINIYSVVATNAGTITGTAYSGINVFGTYAAISNLAGATISGATGITFPGTGTVQNAGTIAGTGGTAITFGTGAARFIDDPGAILIGGVTAAGTAAHVLELGHAATAGTLAGIGETILGFATITFDSAAAFTLQGNIAGLAAGQSITGFAANDTIVLDNFSATSFSAITGGIALNNAGGSINLAIATTGAGNFAIHASGTTTTITTSAAPLAAGAVITHGALTTPPMRFLRPTGWATAATPETPLPPQNPATPQPAAATAPPTLAGWLAIDAAPRPTILPITLHAG